MQVPRFLIQPLLLILLKSDIYAITFFNDFIHYSHFHKQMCFQVIR